MKRKIVMNLGALYRLKDDRKALSYIKEAGFTHFDYPLFWKGVVDHIGIGGDCLKRAQDLKDYADSLGLKCVQAHADFFNVDDKEGYQKRLAYNQKEIRIASLLGAKSIVIHPIASFSLEENIAYIDSLLPVAKECNIKLAIENVWNFLEGGLKETLTSTPTSFVNFIDHFNDDHVVACLDIGHAELKPEITDAVKMIKALGKRLYCLHIHDNDRCVDSHQMPYTQKINFSNVMQALKEIDYQGDLTFEVQTCYARGEDESACLPTELYPAFIKLEYEIGKYWVNFLEK